MNYLIKKGMNATKFIRKKVLLKFILIVLCFGSSYGVFSQNSTVTLNLKDTTVEAIFEHIHKQTDIDFLYNNEEISKLGKVTIIGNNLSLNEVLDRCFSTTHLQYSINNNRIIISVKPSNKSEEPGKPKILRQTIRGKIIDKDSEYSLPGANIIVTSISPKFGATSNVDGEFEIKGVPVGRHNFKISYIGYKDAFVSEVLVGSAKEVVLNIKLTEALEKLGEITVKAEKGKALNQMATVSARSFSLEETGRYASSINDPARMALVYAGVTGGDDVTNEIIIRGNSPTWMQWRLEGIEIPSPNHFAEEGGTSGAVCILSANMIAQSDFYTGAFPAEYGNALSGVFDINFRKGNTEKREFILQAGILGIDFAAEGPFSKDYNGSYLVNYRYSTFSLLNNLGVEIDGVGLPNYQDLAFKFHMPTKKIGTFSIWGIGGISDLGDEYMPDSTLNETYEDGYKDDTDMGMFASGISHTYFIKNKAYFKTILSAAKSFSSENFKEMISTGQFVDNYYDNMKKGTARASLIYNQKVNNRFTYRLGATYTYVDYEYLSQDIDTLGVRENSFVDYGNTSIYESFIQTKTRLSEQLSFTAGLHYTYFKLSKDNSVEPRLGLSFDISKKQKIGFGFGMHSKNESLPMYFITIEQADGSLYKPNRNLKMTRSTHYVLSYENRLKPNLNFKGEIYYQGISKMPVSINPEITHTPVYEWPRDEEILANIGEGRNYGLELTLEKYFAQKYYYLVTASLFNSEYKPANDKWMDSKYNTHYTFNIVGGKEFEFGENKMFDINAKIIWAGGKRGTPIDIELSRLTDSVSYIEDLRYSKKAADYFRIDLGTSIHFFKPKVEHVFSLSIQNVTNRLNYAGYIYYDIDDDEIMNSYMMGILPILSYRIQF